MTVRNEENVPVTIHAYPMRWSQRGGEDRYDSSIEFIVSPPVFTIAPGGSQIVRAGLRNTAAAGRAYRLMVEEVPQANSSGGKAVAFRLNLPAFAMLPEGSPDSLSWSAWRQRDRSWIVEAFNPGSATSACTPQTLPGAPASMPISRVALAWSCLDPPAGARSAKRPSFAIPRDPSAS